MAAVSTQTSPIVCHCSVVLPPLVIAHPAAFAVPRLPLWAPCQPVWRRFRCGPIAIDRLRFADTEKGREQFLFVVDRRHEVQAAEWSLMRLGFAGITVSASVAGHCCLFSAAHHGAYCDRL